MRPRRGDDAFKVLQSTATSCTSSSRLNAQLCSSPLPLTVCVVYGPHLASCAWSTACTDIRQEVRTTSLAALSQPSGPLAPAPAAPLVPGKCARGWHIRQSSAVAAPAAPAAGGRRSIRRRPRPDQLIRPCSQLNEASCETPFGGTPRARLKAYLLMLLSIL